MTAAMTEHDELIGRVSALVERAHWLRPDFGETGAPVTPESLANIVMGARVALEGGNPLVAKNLLAGYLAQYAEQAFTQRQADTDKSQIS
jgi:hypothetical protein